jgi:hypothetical protein
MTQRVPPRERPKKARNKVAIIARIDVMGLSIIQKNAGAGQRCAKSADQLQRQYWPGAL